MLEVQENGQVMKVYEVKTKTQIAIIKEKNDIPFDREFHTKLTYDNGIVKAEIYNYLNELQIDKNIEVPFVLDEQEIIIQAGNGVAEIEFNSAVAGEYIIKTNIPNYRNGEIKVVIE